MASSSTAPSATTRTSAKNGMRATTVRFGEDLWERLEHEASAIGVSVAQYIRDAALIRLVWEEFRRGGDGYERAEAGVKEPLTRSPKEDAMHRSARLREESQALLAEAEQLQRRMSPASEPRDDAA